MTCYVFCLGVNHYTDPRINPLKCAENDARKVAAAFEFRYSCVSEYLEERSSEQIIDKINLLGESLQAGDQFIFYFSGHGKVVGGEQLLLLPGCKLHLLEQHHACLRWATLKTIIAQPQWQGVQCLFIVDACRLPLEANKSAGVAEFEDGVLLRDPIFVKKTQSANHAPLSLFHSCAEGASAAEIPALKAGIFTQALLDLIKAGQKPPPLFDAGFAGQVATRMQAIAAKHGVAGLRQQPVWIGAALKFMHKTAPMREPAEERMQPRPEARASRSEAIPAITPNKLGNKYYNEKNYTEAVKWYRKAAEQGNAAGQNNLGAMYNKGHGLKQDYAEAVKWYLKAAEQGYADGQVNLGLMYDNGHGLKQDYAEAMKWYRKAAEQGDECGQYNLGLMYQYGQGVERNLGLARSWFQKAAVQGAEDAKAKLAELNQ